MGLMNKLKNILFEEEEVDIPVIEKKEKKEVKKVQEAPKPVYSSFDEEELLDFEPKKEPEKKVEVPVIQKEVPKKEPSFNFPSFDEEEFKSVVPRRSTNVLENERVRDSKKDYRYEPKLEPKKEEKPKFKPSPIISPVYGILDKNYTPDEITSRKNIIPVKNLDVESVRKKAFGITEDKKEEKLEDIVEDIVIEEKEREEDVLQEKLEKARTIDELLKDSSDDIITVEEDAEPKHSIEDLIDDEILEEPEENTEIKEPDTLEKVEPEKEHDEKEDTLESDLFDLIDSMYENREDGE